MKFCLPKDLVFIKGRVLDHDIKHGSHREFDDFKILNSVFLMVGYATRHGTTLFYHEFLKSVDVEWGDNFFVVYNEKGSLDFQKIIDKVVKKLEYPEYIFLPATEQFSTRFVYTNNEVHCIADLRVNRNVLNQFYLMQSSPNLYFDTFRGSQINSKMLIGKIAMPILDSIGIKP